MPFLAYVNFNDEEFIYLRVPRTLWHFVKELSEYQQSPLFC